MLLVVESNGRCGLSLFIDRDYNQDESLSNLEHSALTSSHNAYTLPSGVWYFMITISEANLRRRSHIPDNRTHTSRRAKDAQESSP
jgi:hypothetical protein